MWVVVKVGHQQLRSLLHTNPTRIEEWLGSDLTTALGSQVEVIWLTPADNDGENGIVAVHLKTPSGVIRLD